MLKQTFTLIAGMLVLVAASAQDTQPLTAEEKTRALQILSGAGQPQAKTRSDAPAPRPLVATAGYVIAAPGQPVRRLAEMTHFDYEGGVTIRSTVDLGTGEVLKTERLEAYPAPLADEEHKRAAALAMAKVPAIAELYAEGPNLVQYVAMAPVIANRAHPQFGHRLAVLTFRKLSDLPGGRSIRVEVDLTAGTAQEKRAATAPAARGASAPAPEAETGDDTAAVLAPAARGPAAPSRIVTQSFPAAAPAAQQQTHWRIEYEIGPQAGAGEILSIKRAQFRRTTKSAWLTVLGDCRLSEIFVPYNGGDPRFYDIALGFPLRELTDKHLGPACIVPGKILEKKVAREVHDTHVLWMDTQGRARRGEELHLWAAYEAGNYIYNMLYTFGADGSVGFRLGATAHNFWSELGDHTTHLHVGCWRITVPLGDAPKTEIKQVRFHTEPLLGPVAQTIVEDFNGGLEGGIEWKATEFTQLRIQSTRFKNAHNPSSFIAYDLVPSARGVARTYGENEEWSLKDFWVTHPLAADGVTPQWRYQDLASYVAAPRPIAAQPVVIWHKAALVHRGRTEDYGAVDFDAWEGVATTAWSGFTLQPRDFFAKTPLYP